MAHFERSERFQVRKGPYIAAQIAAFSCMISKRKSFEILERGIVSRSTEKEDIPFLLMGNKRIK